MKFVKLFFLNIVFIGMMSLFVAFFDWLFSTGLSDYWQIILSIILALAPFRLTYESRKNGTVDFFGARLGLRITTHHG